MTLIKLCTIASIANFQIDLTCQHSQVHPQRANERCKGDSKIWYQGSQKDQKPKLRLGFTVNNTNEAFVEFLYKGHNITYHLKYQHTITNWTKINTIAEICAARRYSYEEAEKLLDLVMYDGDKYIEE